MVDKDGCVLQATGSLLKDKNDDNILSGSINSIATGAEGLASLLGITPENQQTMVHVQFSRGDGLTIKGMNGLTNVNG